jgi:hypothetical protein
VWDERSKCGWSALFPIVDANEACDAAFVGGPVALAWSRFSEEVRARVRTAYVNSIGKWRIGNGFRIPGEFLIAAAAAPRASLVETDGGDWRAGMRGVRANTEER